LLPSPLKKRKNILFFSLFFLFYLIWFRVFLIPEEEKLVAKIIYFLLIFFFLTSQKTNFLCDFSPFFFCYCQHNSNFSFFYFLVGEFKAFQQWWETNLCYQLSRSFKLVLFLFWLFWF
jgi:hypothetical protein